MKAMDRKLWRDLWTMRAQALAIALVIAGGVTTLIMSLSTLDSLELTRRTYYEERHFADAFVSLKRAPEILRHRLAAIEGVARLVTRVVAPVTLELTDFEEPVTGRIVSIPDVGPPTLNGLHVRQGRLPVSGRHEEILVSDAFAEAHGFRPGDPIGAIIRGRRETLVIVGTGLSPEYIYQASPGSIIPDFKRFAVLWMRRQSLEAAFDMEGAFNDVNLTLTSPNALPDVVDRLDSLLESYGGLGAYGRQDQISHHYLSEEFEQLGQMARIFPTIFLAVAAFLLNVVVSRLITTQREQIAALKAFGYSSVAIGIHYIKLVALIALIGIGVGVVAGVELGQVMANLYMKYYRFPYLEYELRPQIALLGAAVTGGAAILGTIFGVMRATALPPAEAMRPQPPARYRETVVERLGIKGLLSQPTRMILRNLERRPAKTLLSVMGIAFSYAILLVGSFFQDAIDFMVDVQFSHAQREDLAVTFVEPSSRRALYELLTIPGVEHGEVFRSVPVRMRFEHLNYRTSILGIEPRADLHRILDTKLAPIHISSSGIVLTEELAEILNVHRGDVLTVEVLEGSRPIREVVVTDLVREYIGLSGYMDLSALNHLLREGHAISGAYLAADELDHPSIYTTLKKKPRIASTSLKRNLVQGFYDAMADQLLLFAFFNTILAGTIAFGVVYNGARISLSERSHELATLRVLGFTRGEISYILLGELVLVTLAAIPAGFGIGNMLCAHLVAELPRELFRVPLVVDRGSYAFSALVVLVSTAISGLLVRRKLDTLDLVAVLKTKE